MGISVNLITWNEEAMLPWCLTYLDSLDNIDEVCVVDSMSTDRTLDILDNYRRSGRHPLRLAASPFDGFGVQREVCLHLASQEWVLWIDADETYTAALDPFLGELKAGAFPGVIAVRVPTLVMVLDRKHFIGSRLSNTDPHVRIYRREEFHFEGRVHERLLDRAGRSVHHTRSPDILDTAPLEAHKNVWMKHAQLLKPDSALCEKGLRWKEIGVMAESARKGLCVDPTSWLRVKQKPWDAEPLRPEWEDATTNMEVPKYA